MPIENTELVCYLGASIAEDDESTVGGAIRDTDHASGGAIPLVVELGAADTLTVVSDGTDSRDVTITGRLASGAIDSDTITLNDTTPVAGEVEFARILKIVADAKDATNTITVARENGGQEVQATLGPNVTEARRLFYDLASTSSEKTAYDKVYWKNEDDALTLTNASITFVSHPAEASTVEVATEAALDDSTTIADRLTEPAGGLTWVNDSADAAVPTGQIPAGSHVGVWLKVVLAANNAAFTGTVSTQLSGTTV